MNDISEILKLLLTAQHEKVRFELVDLLFTPDEISHLKNRYAIIAGLLKGEETQRELAARLKLSIAKITRGSHALKRISPELKNYFKEFFHE